MTESPFCSYPCVCKQVIYGGLILCQLPVAERYGRTYAAAVVYSHYWYPYHLDPCIPNTSCCFDRKCTHRNSERGLEFLERR